MKGPEPLKSTPMFSAPALKDDEFVVGEVVKEIGIGGAQGNGDGVVAGHFDGFDRAEQVGYRAFGLDLPLERPEHIVDRDRAAVVPGRVSADLQGVDQAVGAVLPGGCQTGHEVGGGVGLNQIIVDGVQDRDFAIAGGRAGIKGRGRQPGEAERAAVLRAGDAAQRSQRNRADGGRCARGEYVEELAAGYFRSGIAVSVLHGGVILFLCD